MDNKRSKGVTFFSWLFIISGGIGLGFPKAIGQYGTIFYIYGIVSSIASIFCGVYLLKLKQFARVTAIYICFIGLVFSILLMPYHLNSRSPRADKVIENSKQRILQEYKPEYQQIELQKLKNREKNYEKFWFIFILLPMILCDAIPIYFFTRPKVKEQFK